MKIVQTKKDAIENGYISGMAAGKIIADELYKLHKQKNWHISQWESDYKEIFSIVRENATKSRFGGGKSARWYYLKSDVERIAAENTRRVNCGNRRVD